MWPEKSTRLKEPEFREAFEKNERRVRIRTDKLACLLTVVLMPLGIALDRVVYPEDVGFFLKLRLICSLMVGVVWGLHHTSWGGRHYPWIGLPMVFFPSFLSLS